MSVSCTVTPWTDRMVRRLAGTLVLVSVVLAWQVHLGWLAIAGFVGLNLFQWSFTGYCPAEKLLHRFDPTIRSPKAGAGA